MVLPAGGDSDVSGRRPSWCRRMRRGAQRSHRASNAAANCRSATERKRLAIRRTPSQTLLAAHREIRSQLSRRRDHRRSSDGGRRLGTTFVLTMPRGSSLVAAPSVPRARGSAPPRMCPPYLCSPVQPFSRLGSPMSTRRSSPRRARRERSSHQMGENRCSETRAKRSDGEA